MRFVALFAIEFLAGSLVFSYWIARALGADLRSVRDGNPGAWNLAHVRGPVWGAVGLALDYGKGFVPLAVALSLAGVRDLDAVRLGALCAAPVLGHAFSPFLRFRGGKAIATSFGVWSALTLWVAPTIMGTVMTAFLVGDRVWGRRYEGRREREQVLALAPFTALAAVAAWLAASRAPSYLWVVLAINLAVFAVRFRRELAWVPAVLPRTSRRLRER